MRWAILISLVGLLPSVGCGSVGAVRWMAMAMAAAAGVLAWVGHRGKARAGGGTGSSAGSDVTGADGASGDTAASSGSTTGSGSDSGGGVSSTAPTSTGDSGTTSADTDVDANDDGQSTDFGPCLSIEPEPEMTVCLCACELGPEDEGDWAPLLLLPLVARRRRDAVDRLAADGRLPDDAVRRLRRTLEQSDKP